MDQEDKPKWLLELENRKQKPRLAHETGAGAHCLICKLGCPGLDLHFWRKICKNCKCRGDDHDVDDNDFPQLELLFGPSIKNKKNFSMLLRVNNPKQHYESSFEWIPPNTTKELASDYMKALPFEKLPIKDSVGAALRRQQLKKQLPLHDIDYKTADELNELEKKDLENYLLKLKNSVGQGKVTKLKFVTFHQSFMTPANATDVQHCSPQYSQQLLNPNRKLDLHMPSNSVTKTTEIPCIKSNLPFLPNIDNVHVPSNIEIVPTQHLQSINEIHSQSPQFSEPHLINLNNQQKLSSKHNQSNLELKYLRNPKSNENKEYLQNIQDDLAAVGTLKINKNDNYNPTSSNELECMSNRLLTSNIEKSKQNTDNIKQIENKSIKSNESNRNQLCFPHSIPEYLQSELKVSPPIQTNIAYSEIYNSSLPENKIDASCAFPKPKDSKLEEEIENMSINLSKSRKCYKCTEDIHCENVVVTAEKIKDAVWHPDCFRCFACNELLVDLVYFTYKAKLYCGRDLAKLLEIPRCFACDELIFVREYTVAEGHNYHVKHFCCWNCDIPLAGKQYISENDKPLCLPCFQKNYAKTCNACNNIITAHQQGVAIKNLNFHATIDCFCCFICKKSLSGSQIAVKENKILCSKECITQFLHGRALGK